MQFDVHRNPVTAARRAYPYVVVMQSPLVDLGSARIVAPLVSRAALPAATGRLTPVIRVASEEYVAMVPSLASIPARDLGTAVESAAYARTELLAAVDLLFFGA